MTRVFRQEDQRYNIPMNTMNQKVRAGYNVAAQAYSSAFRDQFKNNRHLDLLLEKLPHHARVLDVGCGAGKPIDSYLSERGCSVIGIDISEEQIKLAQQNVPQAEYQVLDMSELTAGQFSVDAVVSFYALFHIPRNTHLAVLKQMATFLHSGGFLLLTMGADDWEGKEDDFCGAEMYWSHFGATKNKQLVEDAGFTILFAEVDPAGNEKHLVVLAEKK